MDTIDDDVFGILHFSYVWKKEIDQLIFGVKRRVELIVEGNDEKESIREEQRIAFKDLLNRNSEIISAIEDAIFQYYLKICDDF